MLSLIEFQYPKDALWREPIIPSLLVSYAKSNDFYFSGHMGTTVLLCIAIWRCPKSTILFKILAVLSVIYTGIMLVVLRAHFTNDITIGVINAMISYYLMY